MKQFNKKIAAVLTAAVVIFTGISPAALSCRYDVYAQTEAGTEIAYDWQGLGNPQSPTDINKILLKEIGGQKLEGPDTIKVLREAESFDDYYENEIVKPVDGTQGLSFEFTMMAGMGNFTASTFELNNMPYIKILDKAGNVVAGEDAAVKLKLNEELSHSKDGDKRTGAIVIEADRGALEAGDYVLYFGPEVCGNNTAKIVGVPVKFNFTYEVVPDLEDMISEAEGFVEGAKTYSEGQEPEPGQYPQSAVEELRSSIADARRSEAEGKTETEKKEAAQKLFYKLRDTKKTVFAGIDSVSVTEPAELVYTGDSGKASAEVVSVPDRSDLKTVKWSVYPEDGCIDIDPETGEWTAQYAGTAVIKAVTTGGSRENKTAEKKITVKNSRYETGEDDKAASVEVSIGSGQSLESAVSKAAPGKDISRLRVMTRSGVKLTEEDIEYISSISGLELLDLADAAVQTVAVSNGSIRRFILPDDLQSLDDGVLSGCPGLESAEIPASVEKLSRSAFEGCMKLDPVLIVRSVKVPELTGSSTDKGFSGSSITSVKVPYRCGDDYRKSSGWSDMDVSESAERVLQLDDVKAGELASRAAEELASMGIKDLGVDTLVIKTAESSEGFLDPLDKEWVKKHCMNATKIDLSKAELKDTADETDSKLKARTFRRRTALKEMCLPDDIYHIAKQAFEGCSRLEKIEFPETLKNIGDGAFRDCGALPDTLVMMASEPPNYDGDPFDTSRIKRFIVPSGSVNKYKWTYGWRFYKILPYISVSLDRHDMTLRNLGTGKLKAEVTLNHGTDSSVFWASDDPEVASVDQDGNITAYRNGTAEVTVTTSADHVTDTCVITVKGIESPQVKVSSSAYNRLKISWKKVSGAAGYTVYRYDKNGNLKKSWNLTASSSDFYDTALATGTTYLYKVRAYVKDGEGTVYRGDYSPAVKGTPSLAKAAGFKAKAGKKSLTASWKKVSGASGYVVYYSTKKTSGFKSKTVKSNSKVKYTVKSLKKGKTYYVKARAYRTVSGKKVYGSYTSLVKVKAK